MHIKIHINQKFLLLLIIGAFVSLALSPIIEAENSKIPSGFSKGVSYTNVIPSKKLTFVGYDDENIIDDYAYLAAVPTSVFNYNGNLVSHPLLFYQDELKNNDNKYKSLDSKTGIDYFMDDWMDYTYNLDKMTLINVDPNKVNEWKAKEYIEISGDNPYKLASDLALADWSYSDEAVIAVINNDCKQSEKNVKNEIDYIMPKGKVDKKHLFDRKQTNSLNPVGEQFEVGPQYKYIFAEAWWDGVLFADIMIPTGDPDIQLSMKMDDQWLHAKMLSCWNIHTPAGHEYSYSHVYQDGLWRASITDFPTEGESNRKGIPGLFEVQGSLLNFFRNPVTYHMDITLFPGIEFEIPDKPMYGCSDAEFKLNWDNPNVQLGFTIIGPSGEAIITELNESRNDNQELYIERLGECLEDEKYKIAVFSKDNIESPLDIKIEYSWKQGLSEEKGDSLTSATEGAVLASSKNAPLLYIKPNNIPKVTKEVLYKLGVKRLLVVDIGNHLENEIKEELRDIFNILIEYDDYKEIYDEIREISGSNDVVFSTLDPWTYWYTDEIKPIGEKKGALYIGPAAYIAAHHGTPVLLIENHPHLSSATNWHNEYWRVYSAERGNNKPSSAEMYLSGKRVYDFLKKYDFDKEGLESIITVAGQYEIGVAWDRSFVGVANPGRFCGSPVDTSFWICRTVFYPALIYNNPALQGKVSLENGSLSSRQGIKGLFKKPYLNTLVIDRETGEEEFEFPILLSFVNQIYKFNERASKYYGSKYQCANGMIPGETYTMQPIDQGLNKDVNGDQGMVFPDMSEIEVLPVYLERGGYDSVFSTRLEYVTSNLNKGVILWIHSSHGNQGHSGQTLFWDPQHSFKELPSFLAKLTGAYKEENPVWGYDWYLGSTEEPDAMANDMKGIIPFTNHNSLFLPSTGMDYILSRKPFREWLVNRPILGNLFSRFITVDDLYDGVTATLHYSKDCLDWKNVYEIEELLDNMHCAGFITKICQTSHTYFHLMLIRHGCVFQVQDPWPTSWYAAVWTQSIPKDIILGKTVGEAYSIGVKYTGPLFVGGGIDDGPQLWWDDAQNVIYFGDPDLRVFAPKNDYSDVNYWSKDETDAIRYSKDISFDGHNLFGVTSYPHKKESKTFVQQYLWLIVISIIIIILVIVIFYIGKNKNN